MIHRSLQIPLVVKENRVEAGDVRSILFTRPHNFQYESGDWVDLEIPGRMLKGGITYSLASSPTEPDLMISFRRGQSEFKLALEESDAGDSITIIQYGNDYSFTTMPHKSSSFIAGGIGIAPFRSMLKEMYDTKSSDSVQLLYMNKTDDFIFQQELEAWSRSLPNVSIEYVVTADLKRKDKDKKLLKLVEARHDAYYIAGPEAMVESTEHLLIDNGVPLKLIKIDSFGGY